MNCPRYEVTDVIDRFGKQFYAECNPNKFQQKVLNTLTLCQTSELGGHKYICDCCQKERISYPESSGQEQALPQVPVNETGILGRRFTGSNTSGKALSYCFYRAART
jgi:hypothetical protein